MPLSEPYPSRFRLSCQEILSYLSENIPMSLWMITRVSGDEWTIIEAVDSYYGIVPMTVYDWSVSFSYRMMSGLGPKMAPKVSEVPAYVSSPSYQRAKIGAYVGIPLELPNGQLFGILTGIDPEAKDDSLCACLPELEVITKELVHVLDAEMRVAILESKVAHLQSAHWTCPETGASSIEAWLFDRVDAEWSRLNHVEPGGIIYLSLPDVDQDQLPYIVSRLKKICGDHGTIYREDTVQFFIMLRGISKGEQQLIKKDISRFVRSYVPSSTVIHVHRDPLTTMTSALDEAKKIYSNKLRVKKTA